MIHAVSALGLVLGCIALSDRRAWPMLAVVAIVWAETAMFSHLSGPVESLALRAVADLCGGILALQLVTRERWTWIIPLAFSVMMLCHASFWLFGAFGVSIWPAYPHALNALFLTQMAALAYPTGGRLIDRVSHWLDGVLPSGSGRPVLGLGIQNAATEAFRIAFLRDSIPDVETNCLLHVSISERA